MRRYYYEMGGAIGLYTVVLLVSIFTLVRNPEMNGFWRVVIALSPVIPCALMCWSVVRQMRRLDEMQLRIQFEALGFAFAASAMLSFSYGFLENVGFPHLSWLMVWPLMGLMWIIGLGVARRRYQ